jgi:hypothetical protein
VYHSRIDASSSATFYANGNAANNNNLAEKAGKPKDYTAKVCAIYAKSQSNWLSKTQKASPAPLSMVLYLTSLRS